MINQIITKLINIFPELNKDNVIINKEYLEKHIKKAHPVLEFIKVSNNGVYEKWYFKATFGLTREYNFVQPRFIEKERIEKYQTHFLKNINKSKFFTEYLGKTDNFYRIKWYNNTESVTLEEIIKNKLLLHKLKKEVLEVNKNIEDNGIGARFFLSEFSRKDNQYLNVDFNLITSFQHQCFSKILFSFILNFNNKDHYFTIMNDIPEDKLETLQKTCFLYACVEQDNLNHQWVFLNFKDFFKLSYNELENMTSNQKVPSLCLVEPKGFEPIKYYEDKEKEMLEIFELMKGIR